jgi:uncharacterized membrane-anchored protein
MQQIHVPTLGLRYWAALCLASIFGANMGDFFAHILKLGHLSGLPFLALALAVVMVGERFDRSVHQVHYWTAIIIVRTAATNFGDYVSIDLRCPRILVIAGLTAVLIAAVYASWQWVWRKQSDKNNLLRADPGYWISMFTAGALGTVIGDYCSHDWQLGDGGASLLLVPILALVFAIGRNGLLLSLWYYWLTVVTIRAAGTSVGDYVAGRDMMGLRVGTLVTGILFVALLAIWKERPASKLAPAKS